MKDKSIKKVLVIGSGPIAIGQAAEFDYAGTQACRALKENGIEVILVNSNPATIMTDYEMADAIYLEPLKTEVLQNIIEKERPDSILPTLGGQTGLNLAVELSETGYLRKMGVKLLGTTVDVIQRAEDRDLFKQTMISINEPTIESEVVNKVEDAKKFATKCGYPVIIRPAYTLGGTGGGFANNESELLEIAANGIKASRVGQILVEKSVQGFKEIEIEIIRDKTGKVTIVCDMENVDPVGVHTGDSIVVAPCQTLNKKQKEMFYTSANKIINAIGIEGGCNIQYALDPNSDSYYLIEVNPRVSRSSALASKATGYPIARVSSLIAIGFTLDEIKNNETNVKYAKKSPIVDYCVCKFPRWPFDKFTQANRELGTKMKATGEVMSIAASFEEAFMKSITSLELNIYSTRLEKLKDKTKSEIRKSLSKINDERIFVVLEALHRGISIDEIFEITKITKWFLEKLDNIVKAEKEIEQKGREILKKEKLNKYKKLGITDRYLALKTKLKEIDIRDIKEKFDIKSYFQVIDLCGNKERLGTPYYYSSYKAIEQKNIITDKTVVVLGSGPIRIGQGVEFDYCSVHCVWALKKLGYNTVIINNNPETVSTDFDTADKLYFEPLTEEKVLDILEIEKPVGVMVQFGGQTAIKLTKAVKDAGYKIMGTQQEDIDAAEDREKFDDILTQNNVLRPKGQTVFTVHEAISVAERLGYPVLVRPSYVLGGQGMEISYNETDLVSYMSIINQIEQEHPILIDKYITGMEIEVDAICDGENILIPGIMEHIERSGVHSGDSISVYPTIHVSPKMEEKIIKLTKKLAIACKTIGMINIQYILTNDELYVIEVNPRSSRTVPYISKVTQVPMVQLAVYCANGEKLKNLGYGVGLYKKTKHFAVKVPVFSSEKLPDLEISASPEMKSTGEVLGIAKTFKEALLKSLIASGTNVKEGVGVVLSVSDNFKKELLEIAIQLDKMGYKIFATTGTAQYLADNDIYAMVVNKVVDNKNGDIIYLSKKGIIGLIINTPTKGRQSSRDGFKIRRAAVELGIPCITSIDTAKALCLALNLHQSEKDLTPISLQELSNENKLI